MWFFKDTLIGGVLKGLKSCGGIQYGSLLITIFNHKILIHNLEFLHFLYRKQQIHYKSPQESHKHQYFTTFRSILGLLRCPLQIFGFFLIVFFIYKIKLFLSILTVQEKMRHVNFYKDCYKNLRDRDFFIYIF